MKIIVLGASAGGGFPQWNCHCRNCDGVRRGTVNALPRTQSSIAVSANGDDWVLINASPDILTQIRATPALHGRGAGLRRSGIVAVMLTDAQIDHVTGLLMLREGSPLSLYCTASVWEDLNHGLPIAPVLSHYCGIRWYPLEPQPAAVAGIAGIRFEPVPLTSKAPPYSPHRTLPQADDNIGLLIENTDNGNTVFYAPGLGEITPCVESAMHRAHCLLVDGTMWSDDEMIRLGLSRKRAADMGHLHLAGPGGMIALLDTLGERRKILIHINNTNPVLDEDSGQRAELMRHGIEVAFDGMEIAL